MFSFERYLVTQFPPRFKSTSVQFLIKFISSPFTEFNYWHAHHALHRLRNISLKAYSAPEFPSSSFLQFYFAAHSIRDAVQFLVSIILQVQFLALLKFLPNGTEYFQAGGFEFRHAKNVFAQCKIYFQASLGRKINSELYKLTQENQYASDVFHFFTSFLLLKSSYMKRTTSFGKPVERKSNKGEVIHLTKI